MSHVPTCTSDTRGAGPGGSRSSLAPIVLGGRNVVEAARDQRPNIVVIFSDDQLNTTLNAMPYTSSRPDWINLTNATVNTALCAPRARRC